MWKSLHFLPDEKTHRMLSCLAIPIIGNIVPRMTLRKGTMPYTETQTHFDGLMQDCGSVRALAMERPQSCTKPLKYSKYEWVCINMQWTPWGSYATSITNKNVS